MTLIAACTVAIVLVAIVATVFVVRASLAIVRMREQAVALRKQHKALLTQVARTNAQAQRILEREYEFQKEASKFQRHVETVLLDPKVQAVLTANLQKHGR